MSVKKYPIGTTIRFIHPRLDTGLTGTIVGFTFNGRPDIFLPMSDKHIKDNRHPVLPNGVKFTWYCSWNEIEILVVKGQQLLFSFME